MKTLIAALSMTLALAAAGPAAGFTQVGSGYSQPVFLTSAGDNRLFIVEKGGVIKMQQGSTVSTWFDLSTQVDTGGERGLLGLAFDPNFSANGRFYVDYIDKTTLNTVVASYTVNSSGVVDPTSGRTIITIAQPAGRNNHKGGWIGFSAQDPGNLYIATGDGGSANDPDNNAQNLNSNLGKMLRITPNAAGGYTVPTSNPFVGVAGNDEIWAYGLRNPYRNSFDRLTGDLWIADVGQSAREEIDFAKFGTGGGANYGWRVREGSIAGPGTGDPVPLNLTDPIYDYGRSLGGSIIGGYVYHGPDAALDGRYVFGDFLSGRMWSLLQVNGVATSVTEIASPFGVNTLTSFGEGADGALYAVGIDGRIFMMAAGVPEPATFAMLGLGLALLAFKRRRAAS